MRVLWVVVVVLRSVVDLRKSTRQVARRRVQDIDHHLLTKKRAKREALLRKPLKQRLDVGTGVSDHCTCQPDSVFSNHHQVRRAVLQRAEDFAIADRISADPLPWHIERAACVRRVRNRENTGPTQLEVEFGEGVQVKSTVPHQRLHHLQFRHGIEFIEEEL